MLSLPTDNRFLVVVGQVVCKSLACKGATGMVGTGLEPVTPCVSKERSIAHKTFE
jgi:hypothetical protein